MLELCHRSFLTVKIISEISRNIEKMHAIVGTDITTV